MKRSLIFAGLSLFLLSACGTAVPATEEGAQQSSVAAPIEQAPVVDEASSESSVSSVIAVDADAAVDGSIVVE